MRIKQVEEILILVMNLLNRKETVFSPAQPENLMISSFRIVVIVTK